MFFRKITSKSNGKEYTYLKLIENYRQGDKVKQRVVANLGSLDNLTPDKVENLISGLSRICGVPRRSSGLEAKKVLSYGEVLAIHQIWEMLSAPGAVQEALAGGQSELNIPLLLELMAINQVIKPQNKQAISEWYKCLYLPELEGKELLPHHFYRALDSIARVKDELEQKLFQNLTSLTRVDTGVVFCRLSSGIFESVPRDELNNSSYGRYILGEPAGLKNVEFGLLVSRDGMPFGHRMLSEAAEEWEFREIVDSLRDNYGAGQCIFVGDRSVVANQNLELLIAHGYPYLVGRKARMSQDRDIVTREIGAGLLDFQDFEDDLRYKEVKEGATRYILCCSPRQAAEQAVALREQLDAVEKELMALKDSNDTRGKNRRGALKSAAVLKDKFARRFFEWNYSDSAMEFIYRRREGALEEELKTAGLFLLETNATDLGGLELLQTYSGLSLLGDSLKEIKNFEFRPNQHYTELNISANLFVCVLAAMLEKTLGRMLGLAGINLSSRQALALLEDVKVAIDEIEGVEVKSITPIRPAQGDILRAVGVSG